jgi:hypothetical protein
MTIERPMFPPRPDERCQIIQFSQFAAAPKHGKEGGGLARFRAARAAKREKQAAALATTPEELTATCRNKYLRAASKRSGSNARSSTTSNFSPPIRREPRGATS